MGDSRKAFSLDIRGIKFVAEGSTVRYVSKRAMAVVSLFLVDVVRASNRASQSGNGAIGTPRVWEILLKMYRHETGFGCAMWIMFDDVLRTSTMTEPTTSRGTQLAS